jgi:hypothetical protein
LYLQMPSYFVVDAHGQHFHGAPVCHVVLELKLQRGPLQ